MNERHHLTPGTDDELDWLAFRYVAGELSEEEVASFEARLADDVAACEAVAAMSELSIGTQVALLSEKLEPARRVEYPGSLTVRIRSWIAVGSTAVALGWLFLLLGNRSDRATVETSASVAQTEAQSAADLIARWSRSEETEFSDELPDITPLELSAADNSERPDIPGWMIAAVSLESTESPPDDRPDMPSDMHPVETKEN
jgi:hypothetical protein